MLPEIRHIAISVFTYKKHYCTPNCSYFQLQAADASLNCLHHEFAKCIIFHEILKWDKRVKHNFGFRRLEECKYAETTALSLQYPILNGI